MRSKSLHLFTILVVLFVQGASHLLPVPAGAEGFAQSTAIGSAANTAVPFFSQRGDEKFKQILLGNNSSLTYSLWSYGCGVASLAMIFAKYGVPTSLVDMNERLKAAGGFNKDDGNLNWNIENLLKAGSERIAAIVRKPAGNLKSASGLKAFTQELDEELKNDRPVMVYMQRWVEVKGQKDKQPETHFVVITGKDASGKYLINDPWHLTAAEGQNIPFEKNAFKYNFDQIDSYARITPDRKSPTNGVAVSGAIANKYYALDGARGPLGNPQKPAVEETFPEGKARWQAFERGAVIEANNTAFAIFGAVWEKALSLGGFKTTGFPRFDAYHILNVQGSVSWHADFTNLSIIAREGEPATQAKAITPASGWSASYYAASEPRGTPAYSRFEPEIAIYPGRGQPVPRLNAANYAISFEQSFQVDSFLGSVYIFKTDAAGKVRVKVDGSLVVDGWERKPSGTVFRYLGRGSHSIRVEYARSAPASWLTFDYYPLTLIPKAHAAEDFAEGAFDTPIYPPGENPPAESPGKGFPIFPPRPTATPTRTPTPAPSPERTVRLFFDAFNRSDVEGMVAAIDPPYQPIARPLFEALRSSLESQKLRLEFSELAFSAALQDSDHALVTTTGKATLTSAADSTTQPFTLQLPVVRRLGAWYLDPDIQRLIRFFEEQRQ